jgi:uncharacterized protein YrrD
VKASDVIGRQITARGGGQVIGKIKDLVIDEAGREVIGIVLSDGILAGSRVAPWKSVQAFGPDSVIIDVTGSVVKAAAIPEIKAVLDKKTKIKGLKLLTNNGKELGKIADVVFDEITGDIIGYELSSGLFSHAFDGTPFLPTPQWIELGKDVAFVAWEMEATIIPSGGLRNTFKRGEKPAVPAARPSATPPTPVARPESLVIPAPEMESPKGEAEDTPSTP